MRLNNEHGIIVARILILTDPIGKPSYAPRIRYLCDYLSNKGYDITVYTEQIEDNLPFEHTYPINQWRIYRNSWDWALKSLWSLLTDWRNSHFTQLVRQAVGKQSFDLVFCTTFSTFPLPTAAALASEMNIPWIADIRDLDEQIAGAQYQSHRQWFLRPFRKWYSRTNIRRRNRALQSATAVTTVSPWHVQFISRITPAPVTLVYNGFAPETYRFEPVPAPIFTISYIGRLYEFQQDAVTCIQKAVNELNLPDLKLQLIHSGLTTDQVAQEINRSSIMLVFTSKQTHGMMTTKFYEALGCEKPVLCIPSDDGVLAQAISDTNAGLATGNMEQIKTFIRSRYEEWKRNGYTHQNVINKNRFSRLTEAHQFEDCIRHSARL